MKTADYVVDELIKYGVKDAFGIPGGVITGLLYAMQKRENEFCPHLSYHEQSAGFAAVGYAQSSGRLGVAYATRGPGITNMITCIAEAYQESWPVLFITAHGSQDSHGMRFENNQELSIVPMVSKITKYAAAVEKAEDVDEMLHAACGSALSGRKGPVLLDFSASLWNADSMIDKKRKSIAESLNDDSVKEVCTDIKRQLVSAKRPVLLIGDGLRYVMEKKRLIALLEKLSIPVLSSRGAQDLVSASPYYFGYIGSHGIRYSNFILSKSDLIIAMGNRLAVSVDSKSFMPILNNTEVIRIDIDAREFERNIYGSHTYNMDAAAILPELEKIEADKDKLDQWKKVCCELKETLEDYDCPEPVAKLESFIKQFKGESPIFVSGVGNNEFWLSRAFEKAGIPGTVLCSKSFGTLGAALAKAIGAYYATGQDIVCVVGDQGFQYNIQELQYIAQWKLPLRIVLLNNEISGMIKDYERRAFENQGFIHVDSKTGYSVPDFSRIVASYGVSYTTDEEVAIDGQNLPIVYEVKISPDIELTPNLPKGAHCQNMSPAIDRELYEKLDEL